MCIGAYDCSIQWVIAVSYSGNGNGYGVMVSRYCSLHSTVVPQCLCCRLCLLGGTITVIKSRSCMHIIMIKWIVNIVWPYESELYSRMCDLGLCCLLVCIHCAFSIFPSFSLFLSLSLSLFPSPLPCLPLLVPYLTQTGRITLHSWTNTSETNLHPLDSELSIPVSL